MWTPRVYLLRKTKSAHYVTLIKMTAEGKIGTVVPMHPELKRVTLKGVLGLAKIDIDEFEKYC